MSEYIKPKTPKAKVRPAPAQKVKEIE